MKKFLRNFPDPRPLSRCAPEMKKLFQERKTPPFLTLLTMQMRQRFGLSLLKQNIHDRPQGWIKHIAVGVIAAVSILTLEGFYIWLVWQFAHTLAGVGMARFLLFAGLLAAMAGTLVMGTIFMLGILYLNKDAEALAALPVTPRTVFMVKISQVFLGETATSIPLVWPMLIIFGIIIKAGIFYYIKAMLVWLCALSLPLVASALIAMPLMRWSALWRRRDLVAVVGGLLLLVGYMMGQMWLTNRLASVIEGNTLVLWLLGRVDLFDRIAQRIPPLWLSMRALTVEGVSSLYYLALLLLLSGVLIGTAVWLAGRIYQRGVSAQMETHANNKAVAWNSVTLRQYSPRMAMFLREMKLTLRTPVYAMNTVTVAVVMPVMILAMTLAGGVASEPQIDALFTMMRSYFNDPWMIGLIVTGLSLVIGCMNVAASTALSREGRMFSWSRVMPVPYETQAEGKLLFPLALAWLSSVLLTVSLGVSLKLPLPGLAAGFLLCIPAMVPVTALQLIVDVLHPKLFWTNPMEAVKQNMNAMLGMLFGFIYAAAIIALVVLLVIKLHVSSVVIYTAMWPFLVIMTFLSRIFLKRTARDGYSRVEV